MLTNLFTLFLLNLVCVLKCFNSINPWHTHFKMYWPYHFYHYFQFFVKVVMIYSLMTVASAVH